MAFQESNGTRFFTFQNIGEGLRYGVFTRQGGVSPAPWKTLNMGGTVGDEAGNVQQNRARAFAALRLEPESLFDAWQVHGSDHVIVEVPRAGREHVKADILITQKSNVTLMMRFADCVPILLHDPKKHVIGLVHAGWMGTVRQVASAAVDVMEKQLGCDPKNIEAGIGPSIGPDHYEVGEDVASQVREIYGDDHGILFKSRSGKFHLDLWQANFLSLKRRGVQNIEATRICTACHLDDWYSHRAEKGRTGRFGVLVALENNDV